MQIRPIRDGDEAAVVDLWRRCDLVRPWNDPNGDIAFARKTPETEIFIGVIGDTIVASVLCGNDGHRGWVYYVAVAPDRQRENLGREIMVHAENWLRELGVAKVELMIRESNDAVLRFAEIASNNSISGIVCSPKETSLIREDMDNGEKFTLINPGIRPTWAVAPDEQKRVTTPAQAVENSADGVVVGRPIAQPPKGMTSVEAAKSICEELESA